MGSGIVFDEGSTKRTTQESQALGNCDPEHQALDDVVPLPQMGAKSVSPDAYDEHVDFHTASPFPNFEATWDPD